ncbi:MAG: polyprotein [Spirulinaceae cyanobacterium RM2_2_10]|nr:polyprotein [Spirulinaceae cyanobacterium SM2_1_0]NJO19498.1 polyprotein [Spirulinaceae cyanobacterium RM2_2_10]
MTTYSASGDRTTVGYISGKNGQYEVFYRPHSGDLYFQNSARTIATRFRKQSDRHYMGPDGSAYYNDQSVIAAIQNRYRSGQYD